MATTPKDLLYSQALKPVSIASTAQARKFLPISAGNYTASSNNIIRIPINANGFVDLKNGMLRYNIQSSVANACFHGAHSIIQRLNILSPDGSPIETVDNYNRLYQFMIALDASRDYLQGAHNLLEGTQSNTQGVILDGTGATGMDVFLSGTNIGSFDWTSTGVVVRAGDWVFTKTAAAAGEIRYANEFLTLAGATVNGVVGGHHFAITVAGGAVTAVAIDGVTLATASFHPLTAGSNSFITSNSNGEVFPATTDRIYAHNLLSTITKLDVLYPAFQVGGGGIIVELTLAPNSDVFHMTTSGAAQGAYTVSNVEFLAPVIQYPESVVMAFKQMVAQMGAVSMSSTTYQNFTYPYSSTPSSLSIPIAMRARSLKALYFYFDETVTGTDKNQLARQSPTTAQYYLRIGSQYFPASVVTYSTTTNNYAEAGIELYKSVSKLADVRHGSVLNRQNFGLTKANGGVAIFGIDLEASAVSYLESGINTADNSLTCYLEIVSITGVTAGNVQIFALMDNTISVLSNGNLVATR